MSFVITEYSKPLGFPTSGTGSEQSAGAVGYSLRARRVNLCHEVSAAFTGVHIALGNELLIGVIDCGGADTKMLGKRAP